MTSTTSTLPRPVRLALAVCGLAAAAVVTDAPSASAVPVCDGCRSAALATVVTAPYAEPLTALGGRTLAQYLADRKAHDVRLSATLV